MPLQLQATVCANRPATKDAYLLSCECARIARQTRPGQFLHIRASDTSGPLLRRPFSIHDANHGMVSVLYRVIGAGTRLLASLRPGDRIDVLGPLGRGFHIPRRPGTDLIVAGGMGIAPMPLLARRLGRPAPKVLYGCRSRGEMVCLPGAKIVCTDDGTCGRKGLVTESLELALRREGSYRVFACGPWAMLREVARLCRESNTPCQVSLESFMACGLGACQGCVIRGISGYFTVCSDGPVFDSKEIDWEQPSPV